MSRPRMRIMLACTIAIASPAPAPASAQASAADPRFERVATVVRDKMAQYGVPGVALGISLNGRRLTRGFGVTNVEYPALVTDSTLFQAGSITKTFTATAVMRLIEAEKLELDAPVREYLSSFRVKDDAASRQATVRTLLTHMGGWEGDYFVDPGDGDDALARLVDGMGSLEQVVPFGTFWSYNNAGYCVAGRLIELATGSSYEAAIRQMVIEPLGLRRTFLDPVDAMTYGFAVGHAGGRERPIVLRPWALPRALGPAGGVIASVGDLLTYAQFHLGHGSASDGRQVLSPESMRTMQDTHVPKAGTDDAMALGWQVSRIGTARELWHDGAAVGQQGLMFFVPSEQLAVVVLTNSVRGERLNWDVRRAVAREYLGVALSDPSPLAVSPANMMDYAGRYSRPFMDVVVTADSARLMIQRVQKQGFPSPASRVPPAPPAVPYVFHAQDRLIGVGPVSGDHVEFLRRADGTVGWIRVGGRVAPRVSRQP